MATVVEGKRTWRMVEDSNGHKTYYLRYLIRAAITDGPDEVRNTTGLPQPGDAYDIDGDSNVYAFCYRDADVKIHEEKEGDPTKWWSVDLIFSTKPLDRCPTTPYRGPLHEPAIVKVNFNTYQEEAVFDVDGDIIETSSHEQIRGPQNEWDAGQPSVTIIQNVEFLDLDKLSDLFHNVNSVEMWGQPVRCVKLSGIQVEQKYYMAHTGSGSGTGTGQATCYCYWVRTLEFDISTRITWERDDEIGLQPVRAGWDRDILDEGTKVLKGKWVKTAGTGTGDTSSPWVYTLDADIASAPTPWDNPANFIRFQDVRHNLARVILNGFGMPAQSEEESGSIHVEKYSEADLVSELDLPSDIEVCQTES